MFRRKAADRPAPTPPIQTAASFRDSYFAVIRAFLPDPTDPALAPSSGPAPVGTPQAATAAAGAVDAPSLDAAPNAGGFIYGLAPLAGGGDVVGQVSSFGGLGPVTQSQLALAEARIQPVLDELFGSGGLANLDADAFTAGFGRLDAMRARGAVNEQQYRAIRDAMVQFQQMFGG